MNQYTNPFPHEPEGGGQDKTDIRSRRPVWLTVTMLVLVLAIGYLMFWRGWEEEITSLPASPVVPTV